MRTSRIGCVTVLLFSLAVTTKVQAQTTGTVDALANGFRNVPNESRMRMFWRVFGPAWKPEEIDYQFRLMKDAGIGGILTFFFYPVALDNPAVGIYNDKMGSPEFLTMLGVAAQKAKDTGLRFSVAGGSGWPYGGPTVTPQDSAQRIRRILVPEQKGGRAGEPRYQLPLLKSEEALVAAFQGATDVSARVRLHYALLQRPKRSAVTDDERFLQLPHNHSALESLQLFIAGPTGMQVKRPAYGGEGLVVDHYNRAAATRFLDTVVAPVVQAGQGNVESIFCDSLEVYNANWTHDFPQEFRTRRGYDLLPQLPNLFDNASELRFDLRFDFWKTLAELTEERFTRTLGDWSRKHGTRLEMEAYGTPPNPLTAARYIDVPTGEQYEWQGFSMSRLAASGAHLTGKRIIGTEAWTWSGIPNRLGDSLLDLKRLSDIHFLAGMNELTGVDFPYSPRTIGAPGWQPYYGPTMNQNNPQWPYFHSLVEYINRCQWMLRQGKPVADVAIYLPVEDKFAHGPVEQMLLDFHLRDHFVSGKTTGEFGLANSFGHHSELIQTLLTNGFNYDGIDFWAMNRLAKVRNGKLVCGDGEYSIVILPNLEGIDLQAMEKLAEFVRQGGTLIATKRLPTRVYGVITASKQARLQELLLSVFGDRPTGDDISSISYGRGLACVVQELTKREKGSLEDILYDLVPTNLIMDSDQPGIGFVNRRSERQDIYFLVNLTDKPAQFTVQFAKPFRRFWDDHAYLLPTEWNPVNGKIIKRYPSARKRPEDETRLPIRLGPFASTFVVFDVQDLGSAENARSNVAEPFELHTLQQLRWHVSFVGPDAPESRDIAVLVPWTTWPDVKYFSGQGIYTTTFDWQDALPEKCRMRFEQVKEAGEVWINGKRSPRLAGTSRSY